MSEILIGLVVMGVIGAIITLGKLFPGVFMLLFLCSLFIFLCWCIGKMFKAVTTYEGADDNE